MFIMLSANIKSNKSGRYIVRSSTFKNRLKSLQDSEIEGFI